MAETNKYVERRITPVIKRLAAKFPVVTLTGPRQSGKSTLLRKEFPDYRYVSLENPDIREMAISDPKGILNTYSDKVIFDEIQRVPELLSYIQTHVDLAGKNGMFLLSGSQNFSLMKGLSQSLAGRTAVLTLLPFSRYELHSAGLLPQTVSRQIFTGFYPRIYNADIEPADYYTPYVQTYVERDVRDVLRVTDLNKFVKFLRLCAGRIGQILNMTSLGTEVGVSSTTAEGWLSVLEASYICYRLEPNFNNYNKRVVKSPKLYFHDTGLACNLLGLTSERQLDDFYMRGALFENLVINQFMKDAYNRGSVPDLTFWRDSQGNEVDLIDTRAGEMTAYEIKAGATFHLDFFRTLDKWGALSGTPVGRRNVVYAGDESLLTSKGGVIAFPEWYQTQVPEGA